MQLHITQDFIHEILSGYVFNWLANSFPGVSDLTVMIKVFLLNIQLEAD